MDSVDHSEGYNYDAFHSAGGVYIIQRENALVTGSSRGIGKAVALICSEEAGWITEPAFAAARSPFARPPRFGDSRSQR